MTPRSGTFYGWWVLLALCATAFYVSGTFWWGFSVFVPAILDEFGWTRSQISLAFTLQGLEGIGVAPFIGLMMDKVGARRLIACGLLAAGLGFVLLGMTNSLPWFYASFVLLSLGTSMGTGLVSQALVVRWFRRRRGTAVTILMMTPGIGGTLVIPALTLAIESLGWRDALQIIGVGLWAIAGPIALVVRSTPESMGLEPDGGTRPGPVRGRAGGASSAERDFTLREALRTPVFWHLAALFTLWNLATSGIQPHLFVAMVGQGIAASRASLVAAAVPGLSLIGRLSFGLLSDRFSKRRLLLTAGLTMVVGIAFLATWTMVPGSTWLMFPFIFPFSVGFGGAIPLRVVICGEYFGRGHFPSVYGMFQAFTMVGAVVGPVFSGWLFDTTDSYSVPFALAMILPLISLPLLAFASSPQPIARPNTAETA